MSTFFVRRYTWSLLLYNRALVRGHNYQVSTQNCKALIFWDWYFVLSRWLVLGLQLVLLCTYVYSAMQFDIIYSRLLHGACQKQHCDFLQARREHSLVCQAAQGWCRSGASTPPSPQHTTVLLFNMGFIAT
jgi:hypothetical protein